MAASGRKQSVECYHRERLLLTRSGRRRLVLNNVNGRPTALTSIWIFPLERAELGSIGRIRKSRMRG